MSVLQSPPFRLYLLRHAHAAWASPGEHDFDRRLDSKGYAEAEMIGEKIATKGLVPDVVLSSTAVRCRETAQAIRRAFNDAFEISYVDEMYNAQAEIYLALMSGQASAKSVMLVGHNPTIEAVAEALLGHQRMEQALPNGFPTAGLAVLDAVLDDKTGVPQWELQDFLAP
ncbi:phosphohistidine phosphatase [Rhizobium skierniewicense]|uniref:Phosphohistidine phosphatase n=1 Tax=Rhizobium skierniewicense TaxID=984260 RepID=A0A7W6CE87_9HYPH|nr:histidine phosphatase family protein [Rhizobium skierniewicense]MBB3947849.1 phosphohistidine phosphatase [Rhizobium skierniewicense]NTF32089.1 histidine phosphatase family protein [Rhizobium skierniewicense]